MKHGIKIKFARLASLSPGNLGSALTGQANFSAPIADRLASLTGTDIRVWLKGGSPEARRAAVAAWAEAQGHA